MLPKSRPTSEAKTGVEKAWKTTNVNARGNLKTKMYHHSKKTPFLAQEEGANQLEENLLGAQETVQSVLGRYIQGGK